MFYSFSKRKNITFKRRQFKASINDTFWANDLCDFYRCYVRCPYWFYTVKSQNILNIKGDTTYKRKHKFKFLSIISGHTVCEKEWIHAMELIKVVKEPIHKMKDETSTLKLFIVSILYTSSSVSTIYSSCLNLGEERRRHRSQER